MLNTENRQIIEGIYKSARTGMDATGVMLRKVDNQSLVKTLETQYDEYHSMASETGIRLAKRDILAEENSNIIKIITWGSIQLNTLSDNSATNVANIMIEGCTMGIKEATKLLKHNENAENDAKHLCKRFIDQEQNNIERLKGFL